MLSPQVSSDADIVQGFFNEARAASAIDHPGIVEIYDFGTHTDIFLVPNEPTFTRSATSCSARCAAGRRFSASTALA
jgi:serine/threonine protein kinase